MIIFSLEGSPFKDCADFNERYKGVAGLFQEGTLRGELAYCEAYLNSLDDRKFVSLALDPFERFTFVDESNTANSKTFGYLKNLHGIHTPENHELEKDLSILLDIQDFELLKQRINDLA